MLGTSSNGWKEGSWGFNARDDKDGYNEILQAEVKGQGPRSETSEAAKVGYGCELNSKC